MHCYFPQLANKDAIAQDFTLHDTLLRGKCALDQISNGLEETGVLKLVRFFPVQFEALFTNESLDEEMTGPSVLKLFRFPAIMDAKRQQTAKWLREFVNSCSPKGTMFCA